MMRHLLCTVAALSIVGSQAASAAAVVTHPDTAIRPARHYSQYDVRKVSVSQPGNHTQQQAPLAPAHVYLLRGFMNIFSLGMDDLAEKIQADGIAATVTNHADADVLVNQIVANYQAGDRGPIILIGHSLGADAVIAMAQALDRYNVPVALAVLFDGTASHQVPDNVVAAINFTKVYDIAPGPGFHGSLSNVDLRADEGIDHFSIDKSPALQASTLSSVVQAAMALPAATASRTH